MIYNTTFFFEPRIEPEVRRALAEEWVPAVSALGSAEPLCLLLADQGDGVCRIAIQATFATAENLEEFAREVAPQILERLTDRFGQEQLLAMPSIMTPITLP